MKVWKDVGLLLVTKPYGIDRLGMPRRESWDRQDQRDAAPGDSSH